jgi:hypothetical protein
MRAGERLLSCSRMGVSTVRRVTWAARCPPVTGGAGDGARLHDSFGPITVASVAVRAVFRQTMSRWRS